MKEKRNAIKRGGDTIQTMNYLAKIVIDAKKMALIKISNSVEGLRVD